MRESACYCNCNHEQCPSCDYRVRLINERWPPLHRLPTLRSVIVASNRRAGLCRFVRPVCRNPILTSIFSSYPSCPLCHSITLALRITSGFQNTTGLIYLKAICLPREMAQDASAAASPPPWHASFPTPQHTAPLISRDEVLSNLLSPELLLVDVRRTDYEGGTIKGSLNLPAHSFYVNKGVLYDLCKRAGVKKVAFYCGKFALG